MLAVGQDEQGLDEPLLVLPGGQQAAQHAAQRLGIGVTAVVPAS
ncbi:hypothetical protein [Nonomuraea sp. LPB2021202275-12-8]